MEPEKLFKLASSQIKIRSGQSTETVRRQESALKALINAYTLTPKNPWVWPHNLDMIATPFDALVRRGLAVREERKEGSLKYREYKFVPVGESVCTAKS